MDSLNFMLIVRDVPKAIELKRLKIDEQIYTRPSRTSCQTKQILYQ